MVRWKRLSSCDVNTPVETARSISERTSSSETSSPRLCGIRSTRSARSVERVRMRTGIAVIVEIPCSGGAMNEAVASGKAKAMRFGMSSPTTREK